MGDGQNHSQDHKVPHGHRDDHGHSCLAHGAKNRRRVGIAALLTGLFMIAEIVGGIISGSLALLADAGHMLTDFAALAMAWGAFVISKRPPRWDYTYGFDRYSVLIAFVNGLSLFLVAVWILIEAGQRLLEPGEVLAGPMLIIATLGLVVNILVLFVLMGADQENLNIRGAVLHVIGDLLGSFAAIIAALIILKTGWMAIDPILSVLVALIILRSAWRLIKDSAHILLEGAPKGLDRRLIRSELLETIPALTDLRDIHIWSITPEQPLITIDGTVAKSTDIETTREAIKDRLKSSFGLDHATVEISQSPDKLDLG